MATQSNPRQLDKISRWLVTINSFEFTVTHEKGRDNAIADWLSRLFEEPKYIPTQQTQTPQYSFVPNIGRFSG